MRIGKPLFNRTTPDYILIVDEKSSGTNGGDFNSGAWRTRTLNTEKADTGNHATINSNQITLLAGTYRCRITAPAFNIQAHKARLRNITDSATILVGTSTWSTFSASPLAGTQSESIIIGSFVLAGTKTLEIQHYCGATQGANGFGVASSTGEVEVYTIAEFWRENL